MFRHHSPLKLRPGAARSSVAAGSVRPPVKRRPLLEALESRLLLSADLPGMPLPDPSAIEALSAPADTQVPRLFRSDLASVETNVIGFLLTFEESVLPSSVDAADVLAITGPDGTSLLSSIVSAQAFVNPFDGSSFNVGIEIAPVAGEGEYVLLLGGGITDLAGNAMAPTELRFQFAPPDLQPLSFTPSPTAEAGGYATLAWSGWNARFDTRMSSGWTDRIWLSTDDQFDRTVDAVLLDAFVAPYTFSPTAVSWAGFAGAFMPSTPGTYWLFLEVNGQGFGADRSYADNVLLPGKPIEITTPQRPDLVVTSITAPATAAQGETIQVTWTTRNDGTAGTFGGWTDEIWLTGTDGVSPETRLAEVYRGTALAAGTEVSETWSASLPTDLALGARRVVIRTDVNNFIGESATGETNNASVDDATIVISALPRPDLTVEDVMLQWNGGFTFGDTAELFYLVANRSQVAAGAFSIDESVWLSRDAVLDAEDRRIASSSRFIDGLAAGSGVFTAQRIQLPLDNAFDTGSWYVIVEVDPSFEEADDGNNTAADDVYITAPPAADVRVFSVEAPVEVPVMFGVDVRWITVNRGVVAATAMTEEVWLSDLSGTVPEIRLAQVSFADSIPPGGQAERSARVSLPAGTPSWRRFMIVTDASQSVVERQGEANNVTAASRPTIVVERQLPDLVVSDIDAPTSGFDGRPLTFSYTVSNVGGGATIGGRRVDEIWLGNESGGRAIKLGENEVFDDLAVGEARTYTVTFDIPANIDSPRYLFVRANQQVRDLESDGGENNETRDDVRVTFSSPALPDLRPESLRVLTEGQLRAGDTIEVEWTIRNVGLAVADNERGFANDWTDNLTLLRDGAPVVNKWVDRIGDPVPGPDGRYTVRAQFTLDGIAGAGGTYQLRLDADASDLLRESNETDNSISIDIEVFRNQFVLGPEAFNMTQSGFIVQFDRPIDASRLTVHSPTPTVWVTRYDLLVARGDFRSDPEVMRGSLVIPPTGPVDQIQWVVTGGVLPAGSYYFYVTGSGPNGVVGLDGIALDGDYSGEHGGEFVAAGDSRFEGLPTFALPDTMRGPGQALGAGSHPNGLRMSLSEGDGVTSAAIRVRYDATQIDIDDWVPREGVSLTVDTLSPGFVQLLMTTDRPLPAGRIDDLVTLVGRVRDDAVYGRASVIAIEVESVNGSSEFLAGDHAVVVNGYIGDTTGNGSYSSMDVQRLMRVIGRQESSFAAWPTIDPRIVGDVNGSRVMNAADVQLLMRHVAGRTVAQIPPIPTSAARSMALLDLQSTMTVAGSTGDGPVDWSARFADDGSNSKSTSRSTNRGSSPGRGPAALPIPTR